MTVLCIYPERGEGDPKVVRQHGAIADALSAIGVQLERWQANRPLAADADQAQLLEAYSDPIALLNQRFGFQSMDVVSLGPDHPDRDSLRSKFLAEHTHDDFEVRFFVDGRGLFYLHLTDKVYCVLCEAGDLISVPAQTTHWFDMGARPDFKCIRFFTTPDGWVGRFTGSEIAARFPDFDRFCAEFA